MIEKILFVDDDPNFLTAVKRQLRTRFHIEVAQGGREGLEVISLKGPFAVIVADMRMPEMDGIQFFSFARDKTPDSVRIMLTGHMDMGTAIQAVNESNIFRFLTKPCPTEMMIKALSSGIEQYKLVKAEKELLEQTLRGSVEVLTEILSLVNPLAFSRSTRISHYVKHIASQLKLKNLWEYELAAMLSQIGCVTVPPNVLDKLYAQRPLDKDEKSIFDSHPSVGGKLLAKIPRLESVAQMIEGQLRSFQECFLQKDAGGRENRIPIGAQILKAAIDFDKLVFFGLTPQDALERLRREPRKYNPKVVAALEIFNGNEETYQETREVTVEALTTCMVTDEDIRAKNGILLILKGQKVTPTVLARLENFSKGIGIREPFRVKVMCTTSDKKAEEVSLTK